LNGMVKFDFGLERVIESGYIGVLMPRQHKRLVVFNVGKQANSEMRVKSSQGCLWSSSISSIAHSPIERCLGIHLGGPLYISLNTSCPPRPIHEASSPPAAMASRIYQYRLRHVDQSQKHRLSRHYQSRHLNWLGVLYKSR
jgi:hypothetical protein